MKTLQAIFIFVLVLAVLTRILLSLLFSPHLVEGQYVGFTTTLLTEPVSHGKYDTMTIQYSNGFSSTPITLALPLGNGLHYGQVVAISGIIKLVRLNAVTANSNTNLKAPDITKTITTISSSHIKIENAKKNWLLEISFILRTRIQHFYENIFSPRLAALLLGIVLGVRGNFPKDFLQDLQATGVMHVIAASGMNVTMVSTFLLGLFTLLLKRQWAIILTILVLLFYCVVSGLQASILRATVMIGFALGAQLLGRQYSGLYGLFLAACGMLIYNPVWFFDIGFELSFAATIGIFFIKPLLPKWKIISDDIGTTLAAQIATLPILVGAFGSYGLLSILVNALVLWTIPPLMILGGIGGLIGLVIEPLGRALLILCLPFLFFFDKVITYFGSFQWQLGFSNLPISMVVGYYLVVISFVLLLRKRNV